ncbi:hypothetical protein AWH56_020125 [Anaerobacillus isosaccharinicus]|uniref:Uncharacterized protein n=1 Tax=Anaerobacillus isosaccharinicus TaxID=1532552 RepID=A0A1S2KXC4_9BACI|nr:hypothetical protein [Anaerobacillus isosaccharinicus]MBA5586786.1 hypothetical protein [Anaerobacillus isosaccharinicus]QOY34996.1 hypothetical protein AWH56_020125 [Anaerobacillus isosaccharinicus]
MDIFTFPDKAAGGFGYAYIMMAFLFIVAKVTLSKLKKADKKAKEEVARIELKMKQENNVEHKLN